MTPLIRIQREDFDLTAEIAALSRDRADIGAIVSFMGVCRDEGGRLKALELEYYPGMAEAELKRVAEDAASRWPLTSLVAIHRHGLIAPGENIVLVAAASAHRRAAFQGAEFMMDFLKTRAPFWKREHLIDGGIGGWVEAKGEEEAAAVRWG